MTAGTQVKDFKSGALVEGVFLVIQKEIRQKKNGGDYLYLGLRDKTGSVIAFMWDAFDALEGRVTPGVFLKVTAMVQKYNNRMQLVLRKAEPVAPDKVDPAEFLPATASDVNRLWADIEARIEGMADADLKRLLQAIFRDPAVRALFLKAPAAKILHHSCVGGLIEHTHSVMKLADLLSAYYTHLDCDLLAAGAILHDLGKTRELGTEGAFDYTREGRLIGHIVLTAQLIDRTASSLPDFPAQKKDNLVHLILSHHGEYEFGSPKKPKLREALVLSHLDSLDSHLKGFDEDLAQTEDGTAYSDILGRYIFETR